MGGGLWELMQCYVLYMNRMRYVNLEDSEHSLGTVSLKTKNHDRAALRAVLTSDQRLLHCERHQYGGRTLLCAEAICAHVTVAMAITDTDH